MENKNYYYIDILKLFFSICVVAIHTKLFLDTNKTLYWYSLHCIERLAVPFFFITSGYFFSEKIHKRQKKQKIVKKTIKRLSILLVFWLLVSLPLQIISLLSRQFTFSQIVVSLLQSILFYPWGSLWYIHALIIAFLLIYPFLKRNRFIFPLIIGFFLYLFAMVSNTYYFLIQGTWFQNVVDNYLQFFISSRNGLFVGFFYVAIGNCLTRIKSMPLSTNIFLLLLGMGGLTLETTLIRGKSYIGDHSLFFSLLVLVPALFTLAKSKNCNKDSKKIRNLSIGIYVLHKPVLSYLSYFFTFSSSIERFLLVLSISTFLSYLLQKLDNKYINKIIT